MTEEELRILIEISPNCIKGVKAYGYPYSFSMAPLIIVEITNVRYSPITIGALIIQGYYILQQGHYGATGSEIKTLGAFYLDKIDIPEIGYYSEGSPAYGKPNYYT